MCSSWGFLAACFARIEKTSPDVVRKNRGNHRIEPLTSRKINISHLRESASRHQFSCYHHPLTKAEPTMALRHLGDSLSAVTAVLKMSCAASCRSQGLRLFFLISSIYCQGAACAILSYGDGFRSSVKKIRQNAVNNYETTIFLEFTTGNLLTETIFRRGQKKLRSSPPAVQINAAVRRYQPHPIAIFFWARRRYINRSGLQQYFFKQPNVNNF